MTVDEQIAEAQQGLNSRHAESWETVCEDMDSLERRLVELKKSGGDDGRFVGDFARISAVRALARTRARTLREFAEFDDLLERCK